MTLALEANATKGLKGDRGQAINAAFAEWAGLPAPRSKLAAIAVGRASGGQQQPSRQDEQQQQQQQGGADAGVSGPQMGVQALVGDVVGGAGLLGRAGRLGGRQLLGQQQGQQQQQQHWGSSSRLESSNSGAKGGGSSEVGVGEAPGGDSSSSAAGRTSSSSSGSSSSRRPPARQLASRSSVQVGQACSERFSCNVGI